MNGRRVAFAAGIVGGMCVLASVVSGVAASNSMPSTRASDLTATITANDLKPPECASISLSVVVTISAPATSASSLVLGTGASETYTAGNGSNCILGGGGSDVSYRQAAVMRTLFGKRAFPRTAAADNEFASHRLICGLNIRLCLISV